MTASRRPPHYSEQNRQARERKQNSKAIKAARATAAEVTGSQPQPEMIPSPRGSASSASEQGSRSSRASSGSGSSSEASSKRGSTSSDFAQFDGSRLYQPQPIRPIAASNMPALPQGAVAFYPVSTTGPHEYMHPGTQLALYPGPMERQPMQMMPPQPPQQAMYRADRVPARLPPQQQAHTQHVFVEQGVVPPPAPMHSEIPLASSPSHHAGFLAAMPPPQPSTSRQRMASMPQQHAFMPLENVPQASQMNISPTQMPMSADDAVFESLFQSPAFAAQSPIYGGETAPPPSKRTRRDDSSSRFRRASLAEPLSKPMPPAMSTSLSLERLPRDLSSMGAFAPAPSSEMTLDADLLKPFLNETFDSPMVGGSLALDNPMPFDDALPFQSTALGF